MPACSVNIQTGTNLISTKPGAPGIQGEHMDNLLLWIARGVGVAGVLLSAAAMGARLLGVWTLGSLAVGTALQVGIAGMVLACLSYLALLAERKSPGA